MSKCGYNRNMAYAIRDGPSHLGGSKFTPLYHLQGIQQIQNFVQHFCTPSDTQHLLHIALVWMQYQSGWQTSLLKDTTTVLLHVESCWLPSLCSYLGAYGLFLDLSYTGVYPLQRVNDCHIMNAVIHSQQFTAIEIKKINYCCLYLGVTTVSDITLADGYTLDPHVKAGNKSLLSSSSKQLQSKQA
eukprot:9524349-Ditylum_brightwellii.AAC.1